MNTDPANRIVRVYFPGWVLDDLSLSPAIDDVLETRLDFIPHETHPTAFAETFRAVAKPVFGRSPGAHRDDDVLHWPIGLSGDGWSATWRSVRPTSGRVQLTGYLCATSGARWPDDPVPVRGSVRHIHVVEAPRESSGPGSPDRDRLTRVDATPRRFWSYVAPQDDGDDLVMTGVLVDLDLDDVSPPEIRFHAGSAGECGVDIWVMETSDPILLHADTGHVPPTVTEYLLPLTIESPGDVNRFVHADGDGCWISSQHDIFRCDRLADGAITIERRCTEGGALVIDQTQVFVLGRSRAAAHVDRRHGVIRREAATHPVRRLHDDGRLVPVEDPATLVRVRSAQKKQRERRPGPGQWWHQSGNRLVVTTPDTTSVSLDLSAPTRGRVEWTRTDPFDDPKILEVVPMLSIDSMRGTTETG